MSGPVGKAKINFDKTHCIRGHEFTAENIYRTKRGARHCKICHRGDANRYRDKTRKPRDRRPLFGPKREPKQSESAKAKVLRKRLENYMPVTESGCWIWMGLIQSSGYGVIRSKGRSVSSAHRFFYTHLVGPIPTGMFACHKCDTPPCCNPSHLFIGTAKDNNDDMWRKGRAKPGAKRRKPLPSAEAKRNPANPENHEVLKS